LLNDCCTIKLMDVSRRWRQRQRDDGDGVVQRQKTWSSHSCWAETPGRHQGQHIYSLHSLIDQQQIHRWPGTLLTWKWGIWAKSITSQRSYWYASYHFCVGKLYILRFETPTLATCCEHSDTFKLADIGLLGHPEW